MSFSDNLKKMAARDFRQEDIKCFIEVIKSACELAAGNGETALLFKREKDGMTTASSELIEKAWKKLRIKDHNRNFDTGRERATPFSLTSIRIASDKKMGFSDKSKYTKELTEEITRLLKQEGFETVSVEIIYSDFDYTFNIFVVKSVFLQW